MTPTTRTLAVIVFSVAVLIGVGTPTVASAQPAPGVANDLSGVDGARKIAVVDAAGRETTGRLLRVSPESLTLEVEGRERVFQRLDIDTVHGVGDPLKNGMLLGLLTGGTLGIVGGAVGTECGGFFTEVRTCTASEKAQLGAVFGAILGGVGLGLGALVDALISRHTLLYARPARPGATAFSIAPQVTSSSAELRLTATW